MSPFFSIWPLWEQGPQVTDSAIGGVRCCNATKEQKQVRKESKMYDRELISQARGGDISAFERLVERHRDSVYAFALRMTRSEKDASEIVQESFLSAYLHLSGFRNEAEFAAWVHWIAASHTSHRMRLMRKAPAAEGQFEAPKFDGCGVLARQPRGDWSDDVDKRGLSAELRRAVEDATDRLPDPQRQVFLFKDVAGLSYEQIAEICGDSIPLIKSRLHQARLSLRQAIDHFYRA
jgi:RNA polymerase sigma-70 factor (ECF subfamily)